MPPPSCSLLSNPSSNPDDFLRRRQQRPNTESKPRLVLTAGPTSRSALRSVARASHESQPVIIAEIKMGSVPLILVFLSLLKMGSPCSVNKLIDLVLKNRRRYYSQVLFLAGHG